MSGSQGGGRLGLVERLLAPRHLRWSLVELCRRTTLDGFDHLQAAQGEGRGALLTIASADRWEIAARALAAWAGPLRLVPPPEAPERRLTELLHRTGGERLLLATGREAVGVALRAGETVLLVTEFASPPERLLPALPEGVALLPLAVHGPAGGRYRVVIGGDP